MSAVVGDGWGAEVTRIVPERRDLQIWQELDRLPDRYKKDGMLLEEGRPRPHVRNVLIVLRREVFWHRVVSANDGPGPGHRIRYSEFSGMVELDMSGMLAGRPEGQWRPIEDADETRIAEWLGQVYALDVASKVVAEAVRCIARENAYDPVKDYLGGVAWDGVSRVPRLLADYFGAEDMPLHAELSWKWMVGSVARCLDPGCKMDNTLVLVGSQGTGKSTGFRALCAEQSWFNDTAIDFHSKDGYEALNGTWIYELGEIDQVERYHAGAVKAFQSSQVDRFRPSYGRNKVYRPRRTMIVGTTNREQFLVDPTGNRRYWPVMTGAVDVAALQRDRDQLWAEAVLMYRQGLEWHLAPASAAELAEASEQFQQEDPWRGDVLQWAEKRDTPFTAEYLLREVIEIPLAKQTRGDLIRVGFILQKGWKRQRMQEGKVRVYKYVRRPGGRDT